MGPVSADYFPRDSKSASNRLTPAWILFFAVILHSLAVYTLLTGNMIGRRAATITNARHNLPTLYWTYAGFMVFGSVVMEVILVLAWREFVRNRSRNEIAPR
jgi:hypothetical protein